MKKTLAILSIAAICSGVFIADTQAACSSKGCPLQNNAKVQQAKLFAELCLTPQQKTKANAIISKKQAELNAVDKKIAAQKTKLANLQKQQKDLSDVKSNIAAKKEIKKELKELAKQKIAINTKYQQQFEAILNNNQKSQYENINTPLFTIEKDSIVIKKPVKK